MDESIKRATQVTVLIELEDGGTEEHRFFLRDDEPFDVGWHIESGYPKAEHGPVTITLPRWPSASYLSPSAAPDRSES